MKRYRVAGAVTALLVALLAAAPAVAQAAAVESATVETFWVMLVASLVIFMQAGFTLLEVRVQTVLRMATHIDSEASAACRPW